MRRMLWTAIAAVVLAVIFGARFGQIQAQPPATRVQFEFPVDGQTIDYEGAYLFALQPVPNAVAYLWQFNQDGRQRWEDLNFVADSRATEYGIINGTDVHTRFLPGELQVTVRAQVGAAWTAPTTITIALRPRGEPIQIPPLNP